MKTILMVGLGGGLGSILRYAMQYWIRPGAASGFPLATFLVNIAGCLLIGLAWGWMTRSLAWSQEIRYILIIGFCGGFTTFSSFTIDGINLVKENKIGSFMLYILGTLIMGLLATYIALRISKSI